MAQGEITVAVVGLGYVGLPLAVAFGRELPTIGYDFNEAKIRRYREGVDPTGTVPPEALGQAGRLELTTDPTRLAPADFIVVAVPTPVDEAHQPDLAPLKAACRAIGEHMKRGVTVVFESTVYPGCTEEDCIPILEQASGLRWRQDFHVGYSPERINPGDAGHSLASVTKVVAGDDPQTRERLVALYQRVVGAGIHPASSIKVAEAAKVIENTQRDLNIALMNELAIIFNKLGIPTDEVLAAAGTKWNFVPFRPGLVGGHCIGVDPYYLTHKAERIGYLPQVILAGRRINDGMGKYVAEQTVKQMIQAGQAVRGTRVLILGFSFKEDCPDVRNTRVIDVVHELQSYGAEVWVHDPVADAEAARAEYGIELVAWEALPRVGAIVAAVAHRQFLARPLADHLALLEPNACFVDVKSRFDAKALAAAGVRVWRL